jgi:hypothetical protein
MRPSRQKFRARQRRRGKLVLGRLCGKKLKSKGAEIIMPKIISKTIILIFILVLFAILKQFSGFEIAVLYAIAFVYVDLFDLRNNK